MEFNKYDLTADKVYRMIEEENGKIIQPYIPLYHGSPEMSFTPIFGKGQSKHDYGPGLYTTLDINLAREWAVATSTGDGYLHKYHLETKDLRILNFNDLLKAKDDGAIPVNESLDGENHIGVLTWLATLVKHRNPANSLKDRKTADKLIENYYDSSIEDYDVIIGYRADDSYFSFAKHIIAGRANIELLDDMLRTGNLGDQVFIQSKKAFDNLREVDMNKDGYFELVSNKVFKSQYDEHDKNAREYVDSILNNIDINDLSDLIDKYI